MKFYALLLIAMLAGSAGPAIAAPVRLTKIMVTGSGNISMLPDMASINADITTNEPTSAQAVEGNNATYDRILAAVAKLGVARGDVTLSYYNLNYNPKPKVLPPNAGYERYGYTVSRAFSIKVRGTKNVGSVVDAATSAGATQINGVQFGLSNDAPIRAKALTMAVADARGKALALVSAAHLHIVGIASMSTEQGGYQPIPMMRVGVMAAAAPPAPTALDPSSVNVVVTVSIIYLASP